MAGTFLSLHYHLIFSTKNREPLIHGEVQALLYAYIGGIIREELSQPNEVGLLAAGGMPDHVHLLVRWPARKTLSDLMRVIKSKSSRWLKEKDPDQLKNFAWQEGYGGFTVSLSELPKVKSYIAKQAKHHEKKSFKDEFRAFLDRHDIAFDEVLIWR